MDFLKLVNIAIVLVAVLIAVASAQDYLNYDDEVSDHGRGRIAIVPIARVRRQNGIENARVRRQGGGGEGVTGPVHTFVKTDEHAHFKWGVRHHVGHEYAGR